MELPLAYPLDPMLAKAQTAFPTDGDWLFEPKWDGFRTLVFRDGAELYLQSRGRKPLLRFFPELEAPLLSQLPERCVVDGELVVARDGALDFGALQARLHPAASRVELLAGEIPASYVAFDLLALGDEDLCGCAQVERRAALESSLSGCEPPVYLTPVTTDVAVARDWFERFEGAGLDGVIAKRADLVYTPKKRAMVKLKHRRTADCVVAGFRWHKKGPGTLVGSLMLGLFDSEGVLHHVGVTASFTMARRAELVEELAPWREGAREGHPWGAWGAREGEGERQRRPGATSRWNPGKSLAWEPLRPERVVEVRYDQVQYGRFRHSPTFVRWRDDREPASCSYGQLDVTPPYELSAIFGRAGGQRGS